MNRTDIENDFRQRYGSGDVHTCFVPIPLTVMGGRCFQYGGSTLIAAMDAGVWVCARINSHNNITIGTTSDNVKLSLPVYHAPSRGFRPSYDLIFKLAQHFSVDSGADFLFHCDIPECICIDTEVSRCIGAAMLMNEMFAGSSADIPSLIADFTLPEYRLLSAALMSSRKNHAVYIDGKNQQCAAVPFIEAAQKIIVSYPSKKHLQKSSPALKQIPPLPLNDLKLDSIPDKSSVLYSLALDSQNTQSACKVLKNGGSVEFFSTFSEKCSFEGCIGRFNSDTQIYFSYDNAVDFIMNKINTVSKSDVSFIVTGCAAGAHIQKGTQP